MKKMYIVFLCIILSGKGSYAQQSAGEDLAHGAGFIPTSWYSEQEDLELLRLFEGLRVADVSDGMDMAGYPGQGFVDPAIHPS